LDFITTSNHSATPNPGRCAPESVLRDFAVGKLDADEHSQLESHIAACPACARRLEAFDNPNDEFVRSIESALWDDIPLCTTTSSAEIPETLGVYRLIREVGRGGMGVVYEAEQGLLKQRVAVKVLPLPNLIDPNSVKRFLNGARAAASLEHSNIVRVEYVGVDRGYYYQAMRLIDGPNLADVLQQVRVRNGRVPFRNDGHSSKLASQLTLPLDSADAISTATPQPVRGLREDETAINVPSVAALLLSVDPTSQGYIRAIVQFAFTAAQALQFAHENGVVHAM
jgi:eukaryotic-like serine/threonine-protein kinase